VRRAAAGPRCWAGLLKGEVQVKAHHAGRESQVQVLGEEGGDLGAAGSLGGREGGREGERAVRHAMLGRCEALRASNARGSADASPQQRSQMMTWQGCGGSMHQKMVRFFGCTCIFCGTATHELLPSLLKPKQKTRPHTPSRTA